MRKISCRQLLRGAALSILTTLGGLAVADSQAIRYYEDAITRFNQGDLKGAEIQLKNSLQRDPSQLPARILMGRTQLALGNPRQAEEELVQATKLGADPLLTALPLAQARNRLGKFDLNVKELIPTRFPIQQQPDLWVELGIARLNSNDAAGAQVAFEEALKLQPGHPGGLLGRARVPLQQNNFAEAQRLAELALANAPEDPEAWFVKGSALHAQGKNTEAAGAYHRAKELDSRHWRAALGEATALVDARQYLEAATLLQGLRSEFPGLVMIPYLQAQALRALGRTDEAAAAMSAASDIVNAVTPNDLGEIQGDLMLFGLIAFESGQMEKAYQFLAPYVEANPDDIRGRKMLGQVLLRLEKPGEALRILVPLAATGQADAEILALLGDASLDQNDYAGAERYYRDALEAHQTSPELVNRLGVAQFRRGQREQAIDTLESLVELAPDRAIRSALILGFFYYSQNQLAEARAIADRVVKQQPNNLVALNLQGAVAISQGERREGRRMLEAVLVKDPAFRPARFNLVKLDILEGNADAARRELDALLAADPNDVRTLLEYARFARSQGDQRAAIQQLEKIRQVDPKALLPILELVELYLADGRLTDALTTALALDQNVPENFSVHEALARVRLAQGEKAYARNVLQKAARLAGYDAQLLLRTARLQVATGALEDATWTLSQLLKEQPDRLEARNLLAAVLFRQGRLVEAEAEVQKIRTVTPNDILSLALLGDIRTAQGQLADALATYRKAQQIADTPQLMISVHRTLMRLGRADQALTELQAWHDAHPKVPQIMSLLASHRRLIGETEAAWKLLEELVQLTPDDPMALNALADILIAIDNEKALRVAMRAYELAPQHPAVLDTLGWTLVQLGELDRGLGHLREARARSGHDPTIGYHLAVALQEYGNAEEAKRELRQALGLGIPFPEQEEARRRLEGLDALRN